MEKWHSIFKAGKHTDKHGTVNEYTEKDLQTMVSMYNEQPKDNLREAPIILGHTVKDGDPAYGWVDKLKTKGGVLYAKYKQVKPEFVELIKDGSYKNVSISHYSNLLLRHVAALGAAQPAIAGLEGFAFSDLALDVVEFAENDNIEMNEYKEDVSKIETTEIINKKNAFEFSQLIENNANKELKGDTMKVKEFAEKAKNEFDAETASRVVKLAEECFGGTETEKTLSFSETPEYAEIMTERAKDKKRIAELEFNEFCEKHKTRIVPANKSYLKNQYMKSLTSDPVEFSEADGKTVTITAREEFERFVQTMPEVVSFGEMLPKNNEAEYSEVDAETERYNKEQAARRAV